VCVRLISALRYAALISGGTGICMALGETRTAPLEMEKKHITCFKVSPLKRINRESLRLTDCYIYNEIKRVGVAGFKIRLNPNVRYQYINSMYIYVVACD